MAKWARRGKRRRKQPFWGYYGTQTETNGSESLSGQSGETGTESDGAETTGESATDARGIPGDAAGDPVAPDHA